MEEKIQFAVLIDAENVSSKYASVIFDELEKYGSAPCRRIYGNWSRVNGWRESTLLEYSIHPIQSFSYTTGKNSTDMAMVIDAMDLLYQNKMDGFCLVTSDSDFTRLAMRLREEKKYVLGMGESQAPLALTRACNKFVHLNLIDEANKASGENGSRSSSHAREENGSNNVTSLQTIENAVMAMVNEAGDTGMELSTVGSRLSDRFPDFDVRNYGYSKLSVFLSEGMPHFTVVRDHNHHYVRKEEQVDRGVIEKEIKTILDNNHGTVDNLSTIYTELTGKYKSFDLKDYGYSRISSFLRTIKGLIVNGNTVTWKKNHPEQAESGEASQEQDS